MSSEQVENPSSAMEASTEQLVHVPVPEKPKYTKRKPDGLNSLAPPTGVVVAPGAAVQATLDQLPVQPSNQAVADYLNSTTTSTGTGLGGGNSRSQSPVLGEGGPAAGQTVNQGLVGELDNYSPTHFQGDILSPVYTGGNEVVYDPSSVPMPAACTKRGTPGAGQASLQNLANAPITRPPGAAVAKTQE